MPPRYLVFFKAPDAEAFQSAFKDYSASLLNKDKHPSVLCFDCTNWVQAAAELPGKVRLRNRSVDCDHEKTDKAAGALSALSSAGLVAASFGEAWRLAEARNWAIRCVSLMGTIPWRCKPSASLHPLDLLVGAVLPWHYGCGGLSAVAKTPKNTATAWNTAHCPVGYAKGY